MCIYICIYIHIHIYMHIFHLSFHTGNWLFLFIQEIHRPQGKQTYPTDPSTAEQHRSACHRRLFPPGRELLNLFMTWGVHSGRISDRRGFVLDV